MAYIGQAPANKPVSSSDLEDGLITNSKLAQDIISAETELATAPADTDELLISDAGVLKRLDYSLIKAAPAMELLATTTVSSAVSAVSFDGHFSATYKNYKLIFNNAMPVSDNVRIHIRVRQSNSDVTTSSAYKSLTFGAQGEFVAGDGANADGANRGAWQNNYGLMGHDSTEGGIENTDVYGGVSGDIDIMDPLQTSYNKLLFNRNCHVGANDNNAAFSFVSSGLIRFTANTTALSGITFFFSSGNVDGGVFKLYGIK